MNNQRAFTLAEVLITLGVIGVVAAITLPTVIAKYQKAQTVSKLKKVYSAILQAYENSKVENGEYKEWELSSSTNPKEYVMKYWAPYFKLLKICDTYQECGYEITRPWKQIDGITTAAEDVTGTKARHAIILTDGTVLSFRIPPSDINNGNGTAKVNIDINGAKKPNKHSRDYFIMEITSDGKLRPFSSGENNCVANGNGNECLKKIVNDGWQISDDYPW